MIWHKGQERGQFTLALDLVVVVVASVVADTETRFASEFVSGSFSPFFRATVPTTFQGLSCHRTTTETLSARRQGVRSTRLPSSFRVAPVDHRNCRIHP